jgi:hypothetical protein
MSFLLSSSASPTTLPSSSSTRSNPTAESLFLSASQFTTSINSWIPSSFAPAKSEHELNKEFQKALDTAARDGEHERLGLGHPGLDTPRLPGFGGLSKRLVGKGKGKAKEEDEIDVGKIDEEEEDEGESRVRSVGKGKKRNNGFDSLAPKKKARIKEGGAAPVVHTIPNGSGEEAVSPDDNTESYGKTTSAQPFSSSFDPSLTKLAPSTQTPPPSSSDTAQLHRKQSKAKLNIDQSEQSSLLLLGPGANGETNQNNVIADEENKGGEKISRTQRRREARRLAKLRGQDMDSRSGSQQ